MTLNIETDLCHNGCGASRPQPDRPRAFVIPAQVREVIVTTIRPERHVVVVTDDCTRADLAVTLMLLNENAKRIGRRGYAGVASEAYSLAHGRIDAVLEDWQRAG